MVAIMAVLGMVASTIYARYRRQALTAQAGAMLTEIAAREEAYFAIYGRYLAIAAFHPPLNAPAQEPQSKPWAPAPAGWSQLGVRDPGSTLPFNAPISDARRIVWASFPLDDLLVARGAAECKVNDVVLAIVSGALRRWLQARNVGLENLCVRTLVPVSIRGAEDHMTLGNLVTAMVARLPVDAANPLERLHRIAAEMRALKDGGQARAMGIAMQLAGLLPAPVNALLGLFG